MSNHGDTLLVEAALGQLSQAERERLDTTLSADPAARREFEELEAAAHLLALSAEPAEPAAGGRARLLSASSTPEQRFAPFLDRVAAVWDLSVEAANKHLASIFDPASWEEAIGQGIALLHLDGGPATAGADVGVVRLQPGATFPSHRHHGPELTLVLQGSYRDSDGSIRRPGDRVEMPAGSDHSFVALGDDELIFAVVVRGIDILDPAG